MKRVLLITNDADACGKSTLAAILSGHLQRKQIKHRHVITSVDQETPGGALLLDVEEGFRGAELVDLIDENEVLLLEAHTGGGEQLQRGLERLRFDDVLEELEAELTVILPVCGDTAVLDQAHQFAAAYARSADFLVVHMPLQADTPESWAASSARRLLNRLEAVEITVPGVKDAVLDELDGMDLNLPLALAQRGQLPRFLRQELLAWEVEFAENLRAADSLLLPKADNHNGGLRHDSIYGKTLAF